MADGPAQLPPKNSVLAQLRPSAEQRCAASPEILKARAAFLRRLAEQGTVAIDIQREGFPDGKGPPILLPDADFFHDSNGDHLLEGPRVKAIIPQELTYEAPDGTQQKVPAPWVPARPDANGSFHAAGERFPRRVAPGEVPRTEPAALRSLGTKASPMGQLVTFALANRMHRMAERWAGHAIDWGIDGQLPIEVYAERQLTDTVKNQPHYSLRDRRVYMTVVPYVDPVSGTPGVAEFSGSGTVAGHEVAHALPYAEAFTPRAAALKSGRDHDPQWTDEFMGNFGTLLLALEDRDSRERFLADVRGNLRQSSWLSRISEEVGWLDGSGRPVLNAFNTLVQRAGDPPAKVSAAFTGAAYDFLTEVYEAERSKGLGPEAALEAAHERAGTFWIRALHYLPHNRRTVEDLARAWLQVDKHQFGGQHRRALVRIFERRNLIDPKGLRALARREALLGNVRLCPGASPDEVQAVVDRRARRQGLGKVFSLRVDRVTDTVDGMEIVRTQLVESRGPSQRMIALHGSLVFVNGKLVHEERALPPGLSAREAARVLGRAPMENDRWRQFYVVRGKAKWELDAVNIPSRVPGT